MTLGRVTLKSGYDLWHGTLLSYPCDHLHVSPPFAPRAFTRLGRNPRQCRQKSNCRISMRLRERPLYLESCPISYVKLIGRNGSEAAGRVEALSAQVPANFSEPNLNLNEVRQKHSCFDVRILN